MNRRTFIQGAVVSAAALASTNVTAGMSGDYVPKKVSNNYMRVKDRANPSGLEKKHVPAIGAPSMVKAGKWFDVQVKVGFQADHPSTPKHWITMIKLLANGQEVAKTEFLTGGVSASSAIFRIRLDTSATLEAVESCNLHGTWVSEAMSVSVS